MFLEELIGWIISSLLAFTFLYFGGKKVETSTNWFFRPRTSYMVAGWWVVGFSIVFLTMAIFLKGNIPYREYSEIFTADMNICAVVIILMVMFLRFWPKIKTLPFIRPKDGVETKTMRDLDKNHEYCMAKTRSICQAIGMFFVFNIVGDIVGYFLALTI